MDMDIAVFIIILVIIGIVYIYIKSVKIIKQGEAGIVERLGKKTNRPVLEPGYHYINPFIDEVIIVPTKEIEWHGLPQNIITKDNVIVSVDFVVFYRIKDPVKAIYAVKDIKRSVQYMAGQAARNTVGNMNAKEVLPSRNTINLKMIDELNNLEAQWGVKVNYIEIKDIVLPRDYKETMVDNETNNNDSNNRPVDDVEEILRRAREASKLD